MSEFIGSRIALISKSDIKYLGTLHEINSDTHTVALENVSSYGTEGRKGNPAEEIPGSDQIYEYIVFRGSDVKELNIVAPPAEKENKAPPQMPNDPAILGSARPPPQRPQQSPYPQQHPQRPQQQTPQNPTQHQPQHPQPPHFGYHGLPPHQFPGQPRFQGPGGPHSFPGSPGAVPGFPYPPAPGYAMPYGPPLNQGFHHGPPHGPPMSGQQMPMGLPPGQGMNQGPPPAQMQGGPYSPGGNKQKNSHAPPNQQPQQSPASIQPGQVGHQQAVAVEMSATPNAIPADTTAPPHPINPKPSTPDAAAPSGPVPAAQQPSKSQQSRAGNRVAVPLPASRMPPKQAATPADSGSGPADQPKSIQDATQVATAAVAAAMAKLGADNHTQTSRPTNGMENLTQQVQQMRMLDQQQRGRGRGRGNGLSRGGRREPMHKQVNVPKEDFDFEGANAKFNKQDLIKQAIASGSPLQTPVSDHAKPMANGHSSAEKEEVVIPPAAKSSEKGYDKKSSFFDNISSDLKDRAGVNGEHFDGRAMRREERTKNFETFGQGSVDSGRGYRGRGRGRSSGPRGRGHQGPRGGQDRGAGLYGKTFV